MRTRRLLLSLLVTVFAAPTPSPAQRLFARNDDVVFELQAGAAGFGGVIASLVLPPGCTLNGYYTSPATRVFGLGRYVAWEREAGVCLVDVAAGRTRALDATFNARIAATLGTGFGLVMVDHTIPGIGVTGREQLFLLTDFDGDWRSIDLTTVLPAPTPFSSSIWNYDISAAGELLIVESRTFGNRTTPLMTRVSMATGAVLSSVSIAADVLVSEIAVTRDGAFAVLLSDDWYNGANGVLTVRTATGDVVASNMSVTPHKFGDLTSDSLVLDEVANRVLVTTHDLPDGFQTASGAAVLDAQTLAVVATIAAPRARLPLLPGYVGSQMRYELLHDPGTHTAFMLENETQRERFGYADVRTELHAIDLVNGVVRRSADMQAVFNGVAGLLTTRLFLLPTAVAPGGPSVSVAGSTVTLQWSASPGASYYRLDAGTAPGLADIGSIPVSGTSLVVNGVPTGRYYVRVRAVGVGGAGAPSGDAAIVVP